ncbi:MAG: phosphopyruvate hydratase [Acidiferrobacterales bacterium]|nr:phosphopyruvate hydratase [Acidiferrobacterales bacterium]
MSNSSIETIHALEILDSRGNPTLEAQVVLSDGARGTAAVPSGASTGEREAVELRDGNRDRYLGKGVLNAVENVNNVIGPALSGENPFDQSSIDNLMIELDGTENKSRLGANAILAVSLASAKAAADSKQQPLYRFLATEDVVTLPTPFFNILNGGAHANNQLDVQEFMIVPNGVSSFQESVLMGVEIYHSLSRYLNDRGFSTAVGDEGGFAPDLKSNEEALQLICEAGAKAGWEPGVHFGIALDVASSELWRDSDKRYEFSSEHMTMDSGQLTDRLSSWVDQYPIVSIEDGMAENDWEGWSHLTQTLGERVQLVGDDVFVTNPDIFQQGIRSSIANSILVKLNQIGTLTETLNTIQIAKNAHYRVIISHRSGETEDTTIADLAVATASGQIKTGAPCRSERTAKYNRLLRIESQLGGVRSPAQSRSDGME